MPSGKTSLSENDEDGTTQRFSSSSQRRQCGDATLRISLEAPPTSPRAAPNARGFFCIRPRAALFVSKRGIKARLAESTRSVPHQRDPQTRGRNDAMAWSTPEVREVCVGMEVTSYLSAEM